MLYYILQSHSFPHSTLLLSFQPTCPLNFIFIFSPSPLISISPLSLALPKTREQAKTNRNNQEKIA